MLDDVVPGGIELLRLYILGQRVSHVDGAEIDSLSAGCTERVIRTILIYIFGQVELLHGLVPF